MNTPRFFFVRAGAKAAAGALLACAGVLLLAPPLPAHAAQPKKGSAGASPEAKKKGSVKIRHQRSASEESTAERERRMYRECRHLPNAGACRGFTQR